jgi:transcription initiation factor IIE alpha subunit
MGEFRGFVIPTATTVPDQFFDELLPTLHLSELRVLLFIIRCTYGSRRLSAEISLRDMMDGVVDAEGRLLAPAVGLSKATVCRALAALRKRKIIIAERRRTAENGNEPTCYRLNSGVF